MPQIPSLHKPAKLNVDKSRKYLTPEETFFSLNYDVLTVLGKSIPMAGNVAACEMETKYASWEKI